MATREVVVTGGAGFIGSNIAERLADGGDSVTIIDDLSTGRIENIRHLMDRSNVKWIHGSILDLPLLKEALMDADYVLHQAALPSVQRSIEMPQATNDTNINGTLNVLIAARDNRVKKVVIASSSSVYGDTPILPKKEHMTPNPKSPYAVSKLAGEHYCRVFSEVYGLKTVCLRYFNVYGPRQNPSSDYAAVIPLFIMSTLNGHPLTIRGDGTQTRDFTFVQDVVSANIKSIEGEAEGVFNIACGERISINHLAQKIMKFCGRETEIVRIEPRPGDVRDSLADITLARDMLQYEPEYRLDKGLEVTVKWFNKAENNMQIRSRA